MQEITEFVDVMPTKSINTGLVCVRAALAGTLPSVPKKDIALAVANVTLYGGNLAFPDGSPTPMFSGEPMTLEECETHLASLLPDDSGTISMKKLGDGTLLKLFSTLLPLLIKFLPLVV